MQNFSSLFSPKYERGFIQHLHKYKKNMTDNKIDHIFGGGGWIRTTEAEAADLQSVPFDHSGTPPYEAVCGNPSQLFWSW